MEFEANNRIAVTSGVILLAFCILTGVLWTVTRSPQQLVAREKNYNLTQHSSTERGKEAPSEASPAASQKQQQGAKTSSAGSPVPTSSQEQKTQSPETTDTGIETTAPVAPPKKRSLNHKNHDHSLTTLKIQGALRDLAAQFSLISSASSINAGLQKAAYTVGTAKLFQLYKMVLPICANRELKWTAARNIERKFIAKLIGSPKIFKIANIPTH